MQSAEVPNQEGAAKTGKAEVDAVVACLPDLSGRETCDEVSVNFAFVGSKGARKRMVRASPTSALAFPVHRAWTPCTFKPLGIAQADILPVQRFKIFAAQYTSQGVLSGFCSPLSAGMPQGLGYTAYVALAWCRAWLA